MCFWVAADTEVRTQYLPDDIADDLAIALSMDMTCIAGVAIVFAFHVDRFVYLLQHNKKTMIYESATLNVVLQAVRNDNTISLFVLQSNVLKFACDLNIDVTF